MSTAKRKIIYLDGNPLENMEDPEVEQGGLEGEAVMSTSGFAGTSRVQKPGRVSCKVVYNGNLDPADWAVGSIHDVMVEMPDIGKSIAFAGMESIKPFVVDGESVTLELVGPAGQIVS